MGKTTQRQKPTPVAQDELDSKLAQINARTLFFSATANMGLRLAVTVVIPIVAGVKIDEKFNSSPSWTLVGIMVAALAGCLAVWDTVKEVNRKQAEDEANSKKTRRIKSA